MAKMRHSLVQLLRAYLHYFSTTTPWSRAQSERSNMTSAMKSSSNGDEVTVHHEEESPLRRIWTKKSWRSRRAKENLTVLIATAAAFLLFVMAEMVGSYLSNSLALLSDAGAMVVDVLTYLCNIHAEVLKSNDKEMDRSTRFTLEVLMPGISLTGLLMVTTYVTYQAVHILQCPEVGHDEDVDINYLYGFSAANVLIDVFSSMMFFFKPNDSVDDLSVIIGVTDYNSVNRTSDQDDNTVTTQQNHILGNIPGLSSNPSRTSFSTRISRRFSASLPASSSVNMASETVESERPLINLNMMSAFTHMVRKTTSLSTP